MKEKPRPKSKLIERHLPFPVKKVKVERKTK